MENEGRVGSQAMQDAFVMLCTGRKRDGTYVDLGAGHYANGSNTFRLATEYGWSGIAAEKDEALAAEYRRTRWRDTFFYDALDPNLPSAIRALAGSEAIIDFLSLDLEPPELTLSCLVGLPLEDVRFAVICCEHDVYRRPRSIKNAMRGILEGYGYIRVVEDVRMLGNGQTDDGRTIWHLVPVEDWWVHPSIVNVRNAAAIGAELRSASEAEHLEAADRMNREATP